MTAGSVDQVFELAVLLVLPQLVGPELSSEIAVRRTVATSRESQAIIVVVVGRFVG